MTDRERAINQDLRVLDEAHRTGRITRDDYRARRRRLLQPPDSSSAAITARKDLLSPAVTTRPRGSHRVKTANDAGTNADNALASLLSMRPGLAWKPLAAVVAGAVVVLLLVLWIVGGK